jgi:hypothetical protein
MLWSLLAVDFYDLHIFPGKLYLAWLLPIDFAKALLGVSIGIFIRVVDLSLSIVGCLHLFYGAPYRNAQNL